MYKRLLLAADGSDNGLRAVDEAVKIASLSEGCVIEVIFVDEHANTRVDLPLPLSKKERELAEREQIVPVMDKIKAHGIHQEFKVLFGDPAMALTEYANETHGDMIIIGRRGLNALQEMILGSVSQHVVKKADIPVLVVK